MLESLFNEVAGLKPCEYCEILKPVGGCFSLQLYLKKRLQHSCFAERLRATASAYKQSSSQYDCHMVVKRVVAFMT